MSGYDRDFFQDSSVNNLLRRLFVFLQSNNEVATVKANFRMISVTQKSNPSLIFFF